MGRSTMQKRYFFMLAFLLVLMIGLVGCKADPGGSKTNSGGTKEDPGGSSTETAVDGWEGQSIKVQLIGNFGMEDGTDPITGVTVKGVDVLKKEFEKNYPGTKVDFIIMPWEGYVEKTQAMLTSGEADVYQMPGIADFAAQGIMEPLQPFIDGDSQFDLDVFIDHQVDGWKALGPNETELQIFAMPFLGDARFITYDRLLFDQWGVEYLSDNPTMQEVKEKAQKMTGTNPVTGEQNYGVFYRGDWSSAFTLVNAAEGQNGNWGKGFAWDEVEFNFNSPEMLNGLNWLLEMKKYAPEGIMSNQGNEKWLTKDNNIAISLNNGPGDLVKQTYAQGLEDRIAIAQEFKNDNGVGGLFAGSPIAIAKNSKNKELAWEWVKFATSEFTQKFIYEEQGLMPAIKSAFEWESVNDVEHLMTPIFEAMSTPLTPRYPWGSSQPRFILQAEIEAALTGQRSAQDALDRAQAESTDWVKNR